MAHKTTPETESLIEALLSLRPHDDPDWEPKFGGLIWPIRRTLDKEDRDLCESLSIMQYRGTTGMAPYGALGGAAKDIGRIVALLSPKKPQPPNAKSAKSVAIPLDLPKNLKATMLFQNHNRATAAGLARLDEKTFRKLLSGVGTVHEQSIVDAKNYINQYYASPKICTPSVSS